MMLKNESWLQALKETEPGIARRILSFLKRWLGNLRAAFRGVKAQSAEAKALLEHMDELQALWNRGLAAAVDTYRRTEKNTAEDGGAVQYEVRETKNVKKRSYDRWDVEAALWDALDHQDDGKENLIFVGGMPRFVVDKLGIEGDFYIYRDHAYENMVSKNRAVQEGRYEAKAHYHELGVEVMTDAIMALEDPIASVATKTKDGNPAIISILPIMGKNNAPLYAVMSFYSKKSINGDFSRKPHVILTVAERALEEEGGRVGTIRIVNDAVKDGKILFYDKKKRDYLSVNPETISLSVVTEQSLERNIARFRAEVNAFKKRNKIYYSTRDTTAITDREILAHTLDSAAQTQMEQTLLARYRAHAEELRKLEGQITHNRNMLKAVENGNAKATQTEITRMRNRANGYARLADREETMLRSLAKKEALQAVLQRERGYIEQQGGNAVLFSYHQHTFS